MHSLRYLLIATLLVAALALTAGCTGAASGDRLPVVGEDILADLIDPADIPDEGVAMVAWADVPFAATLSSSAETRDILGDNEIIITSIKHSHGKLTLTVGSPRGCSYGAIYLDGERVAVAASASGSFSVCAQT